MRLNSALGEQATVFEHLCQLVSQELAVLLIGTAAEWVRVLGSNYDGGAEAIVGTAGGRVLAVQAKAHADLGKEASAVESSLRMVLRTPDHRGVTDFAWCSLFEDNVAARGRTIREAVAKCESIALSEFGRAVRVHFVPLTQIRLLVERMSAELTQLYFGEVVVSRDDIALLTKSALVATLDKVADPGEFGLHFESELESVLHVFTGGPRRAGGMFDRLDALRYEYSNRYRAVPDVVRAKICAAADFARLSSTVEQLASTPVDELARAQEFDEVSDHFDTVGRHISEAARHLDGADRERDDRARFENETTFATLRAFLDTARALEREVSMLKTLARSVDERCLIVSGRWGTGKTYHLARHIDAIARAGTPVLFVRAKSFTKPDTAILEQDWRRHLPGAGLGVNAFLGLLDIIGHCSQHPFIVAIDGLNEWQVDGDYREHLRHLRQALARFRNIRLIVTCRRPGAYQPDLDPVEYWHAGPETAAMRRALASFLNIPSVFHLGPAMTNPLSVRIAAVVFSHERLTQPGDHRLPLLAPIELSDLLRRWVEVLADEYPHPPRAAVRQLIIETIEVLTDHGGQITRSALATALHATRTETDALVAYLIDHGLLEESEVDPHQVRFRWQRVEETARTRMLVRRGRDAVLAEIPTDVDERTDFLRLLAAQCPAEPNVGTELPIWLSRRVPATELMAAFSQTLQTRTLHSYTSATLELAGTALHDPQLGSYVCFAALANVLAGPDAVSPVWLARTLQTMPPALRSSVWPRVLDECLDHDDDVEILSAIYTWITTTPIPKENRTALANLLLWWSWSLRNRELREFATRWLCEEFHTHPDLLDELLDDPDLSHDEHRIEMLVTAVLGVELRWPSSAPAQQLTDTLLAAVRPQMYRTLELSYRLTDSAFRRTGQQVPDFQEYLLGAEDMPRRSRRWGAHRRPWTLSAVGADVVALFEDGQSPDGSRGYERLLWNSLGIGPKQLRQMGQQVKPKGRYRTTADELLSDIVRERWYLHQAARYRIGGSCWSGHRYVKAGSKQNPACAPRPGDHILRPFLHIDPTVPLTAGIWRSSTANDRWWVAPAHTDDVLDATVTDPAGTQWIIMRASFHWSDPAQYAPPRSELYWLAQSNTFRFAQPRRDGMPHPGYRSKLNVHISMQFFTHQPVAGAPPSQGLFFADRARESDIRYEQWWDAVRIMDESGTDMPDHEVAQLLGAQWTGENLDYRSNDGTLVVTDPSLHTPGPRALLVRRDYLLHALTAASQPCRLEITRTDLLTNTRQRTKQGIQH
ncbi:NACHT domain-containing protein [Nocardia suismassiliense]|uniref:ATP-binding protein n=1 Tax=Nocardia suismassiliense TaxID=2077092 RepID=UPI000D1F25B4|nr:ATP-binding protein [Nocardia suismassiliense]